MLDVPRLVIAIGWGALLSIPFVRRAHRVSVTQRFYVTHARAAHHSGRSLIIAARRGLHGNVVEATGGDAVAGPAEPDIGWIRVKPVGAGRIVQQRR